MTSAPFSRSLKAKPGMIVGRSTTGAAPPLGLGDPFALRGGDRLAPAGIPFSLMHEWQPAFLDRVSKACAEQIAVRRPWFRMRALLLAGPAGVGRTHAARTLAHAAGIGHALLDLADPAVAASIAGTPEGEEALYVSPIVTAMAANRCANPIVSVVNAGCNIEAAIALALMIDPETAHSHHERRISAIIDLSEVTWIVQAERADDLPDFLVEHLDIVEMRAGPLQRNTLALFSLVMEVLRDLDVEPSDADVCWQRIMDAQPLYTARPKREAYDQLRSTVLDLLHRRALDRLQSPAPSDDEDHPF